MAAVLSSDEAKMFDGQPKGEHLLAIAPFAGLFSKMMMRWTHGRSG